jgi:hypothetical protein
LPASRLHHEHVGAHHCLFNLRVSPVPYQSATVAPQVDRAACPLLQHSREQLRRSQVRLLAIGVTLVSVVDWGSRIDFDPIVVLKENQKDQPEFKPVKRGNPQSSENFNQSKKRGKIKTNCLPSSFFPGQYMQIS